MTQLLDANGFPPVAEGFQRVWTDHTRRWYEDVPVVAIVGLESVLKIIDKWLGEGHSFYWAITPEVLVQRIIMAANHADFTIEIEALNEILVSAETSKMPGPANNGLEWFRIASQQQARNKIVR